MDLPGSNWSLPWELRIGTELKKKKKPMSVQMNNNVPI